MIEPGELPVVKYLLPTTEAFVQAVSVGSAELGSLAEMKIDKNIYILYNCEAILIGLEGNRRVNNKIIGGTCYVIGKENNVPRSLTYVEIEKYTDIFHEIETFDDWEVICQYADELCSKL